MNLHEWQPIETAPKDGSYVLVFGGVKENAYRGCELPADLEMVVACFDKEKEEWHFAEYDTGYLGHWPTPTHWMPLPKRPASRRSTDRDPRRLACAAVIVAVLVALWWTW